MSAKASVSTLSRCSGKSSSTAGEELDRSSTTSAIKPEDRPHGVDEGSSAGCLSVKRSRSHTSGEGLEQNSADSATKQVDRSDSIHERSSSRDATTTECSPAKKKRLDARTYRALIMPRGKKLEKTCFSNNSRQNCDSPRGGSADRDLCKGQIRSSEVMHTDTRSMQNGSHLQTGEKVSSASQPNMPVMESGESDTVMSAKKQEIQHKDVNDCKNMSNQGDDMLNNSLPLPASKNIGEMQPADNNDKNETPDCSMKKRSSKLLESTSQDRFELAGHDANEASRSDAGGPYAGTSAAANCRMQNLSVDALAPSSSAGKEMEPMDMTPTSFKQTRLLHYPEKKVHSSCTKETNHNRQALVPKAAVLPAQKLDIQGDGYLDDVNKLLKNWDKQQNMIFIGDQGRIMTAISFILSLVSYVSRPFLVLAASTITISQWKDAFQRFASSLNVITYVGSKTNREHIEKHEFYEENGCILFQVLLSLPEIIYEDIGMIECLGWEAIIIDECHQSQTSRHFEEMRRLVTDYKLLLATSQLKESVPEYLNLLDFLDVEVKDHLPATCNDKEVLPILRARLADYLVSQKSTFERSNFIEYWVPVHLSDVQLELYCQCLLDNCTSLRSCSKTDSIDALRSAVDRLRKCCDHPYLVEPMLQHSLRKSPDPVELLKVGINACGKLVLLDKILNEVHKQGHRVLLLYQETCGPRIGDILDDFVRQRFGEDSYEHLGSAEITSKRQAALNKFNDVEHGRFILLLNRARSSINVSHVNIVIIFNSDLHLSNDVRVLQKIHFLSQTEKPKVLRLYCCYTVEEKVLVLAKQEFTLDSGIQSLLHTTCHQLLMWCASHLFDRLDKFHSNKIPANTNNGFSVDEVVQNLLHVISSCDNDQSVNIISKVEHYRSLYASSTPTPGEKEPQAMDEVPLHDFWSNLLAGRVPSWKYVVDTSQKTRKWTKSFDTLIERQGTETLQQKSVNSTVDPVNLQPWIEEVKRKSFSENKKKKNSCSDVEARRNDSSDLDRTNPSNALKCSLKIGEETSSKVPETSDTSEVRADNNTEMVETDTLEPETVRKLQDAQLNLQKMLRPMLYRLCEALHIPNGVKDVAGRFLEYVLCNHHVPTEPAFVLHAFMISLCWSAAAMANYKMEHEKSLLLAKEHMDFQCTTTVADSAFEKVRQLEPKFLQSSGCLPSVFSSSRLGTETSVSLSSESDILEEGEIAPSDGELLDQNFSPGVPKSTKINSELCPKGSHVRCSSLSKEKGSSDEEVFDKVEKLCQKRKDDVDELHRIELEEFGRYRDELKKELEEQHILDVARIRAMHETTCSHMLDELKIRDGEFTVKLAKIDACFSEQRDELECKQKDATLKEKRIKARWLVSARTGRRLEALNEVPLSETGFDMIGLKKSLQSKLIQHSIKVVHRSPDTQHTVTASPTCHCLSGRCTSSSSLHVLADREDAMASERMDYTVVESPTEKNLGCCLDSGKIAGGLAACCGASADGTCDNGLTGGAETETGLPDCMNTNLNSTANDDCNTSSGEDVVASERQGHPMVESLTEKNLYCSFDNDNNSGGLTCSYDGIADGTYDSRLTGEVETVIGFPECANGNVNRTANDDCNTGSGEDAVAFERRDCNGPESHREKSLGCSFDSSKIPGDLACSYNACADGTCDNRLTGEVETVTGLPECTNTKVNRAANDDCHSSSGELKQLAAERNAETVSDLACSNEVTFSVSASHCQKIAQASDSDCISSEHATVSSTMVDDQGNKFGVTCDLPGVLPPGAGCLSGNVSTSCQVPNIVSSSTPEVLEVLHEEDNQAVDSSATSVAPSLECEIPALPHQSGHTSHKIISLGLFHHSSNHLPPVQAAAVLPIQDTSQTTEQFNRTESSMQSGTGAMTTRPQILLQREGVSTCISGPSQTCTTSSIRQAPMNANDPLANLIAKLHQERLTTVTMHNEEKHRLASDCEREIEKVRRKYDSLIQESEMRFKERMSYFESFRNKVGMNLTLASLCKQRYTDRRTSQSKSGPQTNQARLPPSTHAASLLQCQSSQRPNRAPNSVAPQVVHHSSALFAGNPRAPVSSPIIPRTFAHVGADLRAPAPHLHPYRPVNLSVRTGVSTLPAMCSPIISSHISSSACSTPSLPSLPLSGALIRKNLQCSATQSTILPQRELDDAHLLHSSELPISSSNAPEQQLKQSGEPPLPVEGTIFCLSDED